MPEREPRLEHWSYEHFREKIIAAAQEGEAGIAGIHELPHTLDFGPIGKRLLRIAHDHDVSAREYSLEMIYDPGSNGIRLSKEAAQGEASEATFQPRLLLSSTTEVMTPTDKAYLDYGLAQPNMLKNKADVLLSDQKLGRLIRRYCAQPIGYHHTHTNNSSFSPNDIASFLYLPFMRCFGLLMPDRTLAALVRSHDTLSLTTEQVYTYRKKWLAQLKERIEQTPTSPKNRRDYHYRAVHAMVRTLAKRYQFGYYRSAAANSIVLQRVPDHTSPA